MPENVEMFPLVLGLVINMVLGIIKLFLDHGYGSVRRRERRDRR